MVAMGWSAGVFVTVWQSENKKSGPCIGAPVCDGGERCGVRFSLGLSYPVEAVAYVFCLGCDKFVISSRVVVVLNVFLYLLSFFLNPFG